MVTPFAEDGARRPRRGARGSRATWSTTARTASSSPARPASRRRSTDDEKLALLAAVKDEVGDEATVICGTGLQRHPPLARADRARAARPGADAVLVVTPYYNKPNRAGLRAHFEAVAEAAGETPVVLYNIPSRVRDQPAARAARRARGRDRRTSSPSSRRTTTSSGRSRGSTSSPATTRSSCARSSSAAPAASSSPRTWSAPRCARSTTRRRPATRDRAREIDARLQPIYEALTVTANPIPVKAALEMLGADSARTAAADGRRPTRSSARSCARRSSARPAGRRRR